MYNIFAFFLKDHESGEKEFLKKKCGDKVGDLLFGYDDSNYYFWDVQNDLFNEANKSLIYFINNYCEKIRNFLDNKVKYNYKNQFIIAVHPPGSLNTMELLEWQQKMKGLNNSSNNFIVYYSSKDSENAYLTNHNEFNYDYQFLFNPNKKTKEERECKDKKFKKFLELLNARLEGKEIEFFDLKKKLDNLFYIFFEKALICKGLLECLEKERFTESETYYFKSFGDKDFKTILAGLKEKVEVKELEDIRYEKIFKEVKAKLRELNPGSYKDLTGDSLKTNENKLLEFLDWYVGFLRSLLNSMKEVEKSGN